MAVRHLVQAPEEVEATSVVTSEVVSLARGADTPAERIRRLQWEARVLAAEQAEAFGADLLAMAARAVEIADGGEAYPAGVRELASRIAADLPQKAQSLLTILHRNGGGA